MTSPSRHAQTIEQGAAATTSWFTQELKAKYLDFTIVAALYLLFNGLLYALTFLCVGIDISTSVLGMLVAALITWLVNLAIWCTTGRDDVVDKFIQRWLLGAINLLNKHMSVGFTISFLQTLRVPFMGWRGLGIMAACFVITGIAHALICYGSAYSLYALYHRFRAKTCNRLSLYSHPAIDSCPAIPSLSVTPFRANFSPEPPEPPPPGASLSRPLTPEGDGGGDGDHKPEKNPLMMTHRDPSNPITLDLSSNNLGQQSSSSAALIATTTAAADADAEKPEDEPPSHHRHHAGQQPSPYSSSSSKPSTTWTTKLALIALHNPILLLSALSIPITAAVASLTSNTVFLDTSILFTLWLGSLRLQRGIRNAKTFLGTRHRLRTVVAVALNPVLVTSLLLMAYMAAKKEILTLTMMSNNSNSGGTVEGRTPTTIEDVLDTFHSGTTFAQFLYNHTYHATRQQQNGGGAHATFSSYLPQGVGPANPFSPHMVSASSLPLPSNITTSTSTAIPGVSPSATVSATVTATAQASTTTPLPLPLPPPCMGAGDIAMSILEAGLVSWGIKLFSCRHQLLSPAGMLVVFVSSLFAAGTVVSGPLLARALGLGPKLSLAFAARSVTLALGTPALVRLGGDVGANAVMVVLNGVLFQMGMGVGVGEWVAGVWRWVVVWTGCLYGCGGVEQRDLEKGRGRRGDGRDNGGGGGGGGVVHGGRGRSHSERSAAGGRNAGHAPGPVPVPDNWPLPPIAADWPLRSVPDLAPPGPVLGGSGEGRLLVARHEAFSSSSTTAVASNPTAFASSTTAIATRAPPSHHSHHSPRSRTLSSSSSSSPANSSHSQGGGGRNSLHTVASGVTIGINAAAMGTSYLYEQASPAAPYAVVAMTAYGIVTVVCTCIPQLVSWLVWQVNL